MDFFTTLDSKMNVLFVLVIIHHKTRKIIHFGVTTNPTADWTVNQLREATPFDEKPKYIVHDNDSIFSSAQVQNFLKSSKIVSKRTAYSLNGGTPIPSPEYPPTTMKNRKLKATPILNGLYHTYEKVA